MAAIFKTVLESSTTSSNQPYAPALKNYTEELPNLASSFEPVYGQQVVRLRAVCIHANITIRAMREEGNTTWNVSKNYFPYRVWRNWQASIDPTTFSRTSAYDSGYGRGVSNVFVLDTAGFTPKNTESDKDVPGLQEQITRVTSAERMVLEFVFGWRRDAAGGSLPPYGGIYFVVCVDVTPTHYRVGVAKAIPISRSRFTAYMLGQEHPAGPIPLNRIWYSPEYLDANLGWSSRHQEPVDWADLNNLLPLASGSAP